MNKYKRLASNTLLFAISNFSSKMLTFFLKPMYSRAVPIEEMGVYNNVWGYVILLLPLITLGMDYAVLRFGLDKSYNRKSVFTNSLAGLAIGFGILAACYPAMRLLPNIEGYLLPMYVMLFVSNLRRICANFVRAKNLLRLVAIDGILTSFTTVMFNVVFLVWMKTGAVGILWATVAADLCSSLFLIWVASLGRYIRPARYNHSLMGQMLRYALPLVPSLMCWNITNSSDVIFVTNMLEDGKRLAGLLGYSYVLAQAVQMAAYIFNDAWQLSAVTEKEGREVFFSRIFSAYQSTMFIGGAILILLCKPFYGMYLKGDDAEAWLYAPFLVMATIYSCFSGFLNSIYVVEKRSGLSLFTSAVGALVNCVLNLILITFLGVTGAALATFFSYVSVFALRAVNTSGLLKVEFSVGMLTINTGLLALECTLMILQVKWWPVWCTLCAVVVLVLNFAGLWKMAKRILGKTFKKKKHPHHS